MGPPGSLPWTLQRSLNDRLRAAVGAEHFGMQLFTEVDLRFRVVAGVPFVLDDLEPQVIQRPSHLVELVLRLDDDLVEALRDRPGFLLLGERAEMTLAPPVAAGAADPCIQDLPIV